MAAPELVLREAVPLGALLDEQDEVRRAAPDLDEVGLHDGRHRVAALAQARAVHPVAVVAEHDGSHDAAPCRIPSPCRPSSPTGPAPAPPRPPAAPQTHPCTRALTASPRRRGLGGGSAGDCGADAHLRPGDASNAGCQAGARREGRMSPTRIARRGSRGNRVCPSCALIAVMPTVGLQAGALALTAADPGRARHARCGQCWQAVALPASPSRP